MLDIKFIRENPDVVRENIRKKFQEEKLPLVDEVIALDARKRATQQEDESLKAARNKLSKANGPLFGQLKKCTKKKSLGSYKSSPIEFVLLAITFLAPISSSFSKEIVLLTLANVG